MKATVKELVVISGKGGTGKTSVAASLAALAERPVMADGDVDAADLHLVLAPDIRERHDFYAGREAVIRRADCTRCGECERLCRFQAVRRPDGDFVVDAMACEGCGICVRFCPAGAIDFPERRCGEWMRSETRLGPLVHARLAAAAENSGKLVSLVRREARRVAEQTDREWLIVDGPPGIGCPVIAVMGGASLVLAVTEPTLSGEHDLRRVLALAKHFSVPAAVCVNKWDIRPDMTDRIETLAVREGARIAGRIRYDPGVTRAQIEGRAVVETDAPAAEDFKELWKAITH